MSSTTKEPKVRLQPQLSVNKMGEYMTANPLRRRKILRDAKFPPTFLVKRYETACETIIDYFTQGRDMSVVDRKIREIESRRGGTTFEIESNLLALEALNLFYENGDELPLPEPATLLSGLGGNLPHLVVHGTHISIRPELLIKHQVRDQEYIGALKLYFSKTVPMSREVAGYVGVLMRHQLQQLYEPRTKVNGKCCVVYDVFHNQLHISPAAYKQKFDHVTAACAEIAALWDGVTIS